MFPGALVIMCRGVIGMVFACSMLAKIWGRPAYQEFRAWVAALPVPGSRSRLTAPLIVAAELAAAVMVAVPGAALAGLAVAVVVLTVFSAGTLIAVRQGTELTCNCFGRSGKRLGVRHVVRDCVLAVAALAAACGVAAGTPGVRPVAAALCLGAAVVVAALIVFSDDITTLFGALMSGEDVPLWTAELEEERVR